MGGPGFLGRHGNVYLYVPNLIGYARVVCTIRSFMVAFKNPALSVLLYFASFVCDELDGRFARMLNQSSTFGAVLDMVTDRVATTGLLVVLCMVHTEQFGWFLGLLMLDITSHWFHMYASLIKQKASHKDVSNSEGWLLRTYYGSRVFMGWCCVSAEVCYLAMYLYTWEEYRKGPLVPMNLSLPWSPSRGGTPLAVMVVYLTLPGTIMKQVLNALQLKAGCEALVRHDKKED